MRFRFSPLQLAASLILVCTVVLATVILLRRSRPVEAPQLVQMLPETPGVLLYLDLKGMRDSGILDHLVGSKLNEEPDYSRFVEQSGFDYKTDLDGMVAKITDNAKFFLLTGRFDWKTLIRYTTSNGGTCRNGFCSVQGSDSSRMMSFYALRPNVMALAIGPDSGAAYLIKQRKGDLPATPAAPIWLTVPGSVLQQYANAPAGTRVFLRALSGAEKVQFTLGPQGERFELVMDVTCGNSEDAAILRAQLEGVTSELRKMIALEKQTPNPADLSGVLSAGSFERQTRHVMGRWPVERSFLYSLGGS